MGEVARIILGYQFRKKIEYSSNGKFKIILMKNVKNDSINVNTLYRTNIENIKEQFLISRGDILFFSKGADTRAIYIDFNYPFVVATSNFFIIRAKDKSKILPRYLAWYINQRTIQARLRKYFEGTSLPKISLKSLEKLRIYLPDIETQQRIVDIFMLNLKEREIAAEIQNLRNRIVERTLLKKVMDN